MAAGALSIACERAEAASPDIQLPANHSTQEGNSSALWKTLAALDFPIETHTSFRETRSSRILRKPAEQRGTLWIDATGDFVMQVREPRMEERRLSEQRLSLLRSRTDRQGNIHQKERSIKLDPGKATHQLLLSIVDVLKGNTERLQKEFTIASATTSTDTNWIMVLTPVRTELRNDLEKLVLRGRGRLLQSLRTERNSTSWQEIEILTTRATPVKKTTGD